MAPQENLSSKAMYGLAGRVALVTGGGTGIGLMIAQGLATNGAKVYISGRRRDVLDKAASAFKNAGGSLGSMHPLTMDCTDKSSILAAVNEIETQDGKLHILVNNSGQVGPVSPFFNDKSAPEHKDPGTLARALFDNESFEGWSSLYSINTFSIFFVSTAFVDLLTKGNATGAGVTSSIVNITSMSGILKLAQRHFAYNSSKAAASHLTKMLATEFALKGIPVRVNAIAPGPYASEMTFDEIVGSEETHKVSQCLIPIPAERAGNATEMAGTIVYLVSPAGGYVNGQEIVIDGGALAVNPSTA